MCVCVCMPRPSLQTNSQTHCHARLHLFHSLRIRYLLSLSSLPAVDSQREADNNNAKHLRQLTVQHNLQHKLTASVTNIIIYLLYHNMLHTHQISNLKILNKKTHSTAPCNLQPLPPCPGSRLPCPFPCPCRPRTLRHHPG